MVRGDEAACGVGPIARRPGARQPRNLAQRGLHLPRVEQPPRARQSLGGELRRRADVVEDDEAAELVANPGEPARDPAVAAAVGQPIGVGVERLAQRGDRHRLACGLDHGGDGAGGDLAEPFAQLDLEIAERHPAIDRAARGEGDHHRLGATGLRGGGGSGAVDRGGARFERGKLRGKRGFA